MIPSLSQTSLKPCNHPLGAGTYPPSPNTGSITIQATSCAGICCLKSKAKWERESSVIFSMGVSEGTWSWEA